ncbi:MAG: hypothetical protein WC364_02125 [Eubacteriales bacterium]
MNVEKPKFTGEEYKQHFETKEKALQDALESLRLKKNKVRL